MLGNCSWATTTFCPRCTRVFFATMAIVSSLLFFLAPLAVWSAFVNFLTLPLVALMFVAEFLVRRRVLAETSGAPLDALRAYLNRSSRAD